MDVKYIGIATIASALMLTACSSGSDSNPKDNLIIGGSESGIAADDVATDDLRRSAAKLASDSLGLNINEVLGIPFVNGSASSEETVLVGTDGTTTTTMLGDTVENGDTLDDDVDSLMRTSLALDSTQATITREGNIITIDPDENELCNEEVLGNMVEADSSCVAVYKDLTVVLDARTDDTGILTYQFQEQPLLVIGYSPNGGSYEVNLGGLKQVLQASADQDPDQVNALPDTLAGAIRVTAIVSNESGVAEAGSMSLAVTQPISIIDSAENVNLSLANSELFNVSSDSDGNTKISSSYGALSASFPAILDNADPNAQTDIVSLMMQGLTSQLDIDSGGEQIKLANSGSALTVAINSGEAIRLSISNYGMTISSDKINIDPGLTLGVSMTNVIGELTDGLYGNSAQLDIAMPSGTVLESNPASDSTKISSGGLSYGFSTNTNEGTIGNTFSATAGDCFEPNNSGSSEDENQLDSAPPLVIVSCDAP